VAFHYSEPFERLLDPARPEGAVLATARVVVVGSGYGGAVAAFRLADLAGAAEGRDHQVLVLERGREYALGEFPQTFDDVPDFARAIRGPQTTPGAHDDALFQFRIGTGVDVVVGSGLGGTSLINANVAAHPAPSTFASSAWPERIRAEAADPGSPFNQAFAKVAEFLGVADSEDDRRELESLAKYQALAHYARKLNFDVGPAPITVTLGRPGTSRVNRAGVRQKACTLCGNCVTGCNVGAKNTLAMNLIPAAVQRGAKFLTGAQVLRVESLGEALGYTRSAPAWRIWVRAVQRETRVRCDGVYPIDADVVVLAGGALGSTEILQRSAACHGLACSPQLGSRFSTNGDALAMSFAESDPVHAIGQEDQQTPNICVGPTITALARGKTTKGEAFTLEEGAVPAGLADGFGELVTTGAQFGRLGDNRLPGWFHGADASGADPLSVQRKAVENSQLFLIMGDDGAHGELKLTGDAPDGLDSAVSLPVWHSPMASPAPGGGASSSADPSPVLTHIEQTLSQFDRGPNQKYGQFVNNPLWRLLPDSAAAAMAGQFPGGRLITVHPLGGCAMADDGRNGVVDHTGQVFKGASDQKHPGLYVLDGSIVPGALGINPFLTIASLAWRACDHILEQLGGEARPYLPANPHDPPALPSVPVVPQTPPPRIIIREQLVGRLTKGHRRAAAALKSLHHGRLRDSDVQRSFEANGLILRVETEPFAVSALANPAQPLAIKAELYRNTVPTQDSLRADAYGVPVERLTPETLIARGTGQLTVLNPSAPRGWPQKIWRAFAALVAYLIRRELPWDLIRSQWARRSDSSVAKQPVLKVLRGLANAASMHGTYRDFTYSIDLRSVAATAHELTAGARPEISLHGRKRISWRPGHERLWAALLHLKTDVQFHTGNRSSARRAAQAMFRVDAEYLIGRGLMQIEPGTSVPSGILSCAAFVLRMARCAIQAGFWEFGAPEYPPSHKRPKSKPGLPARLKSGLCLETRELRVPCSLPERPDGESGSERTGQQSGTIPILLHRYRTDDRSDASRREPVLLIHGLAQGSLIFAHPAMEVSMADYLAEKGYDIWLLDYRLSNQLSAQDVPNTGWSMDEIGAFDVPMAVDALLENYPPETRVHVFAHCVGAVATTMAILRGDLTRDKLASLALNAIHPWTIASPANAVRAKFAVFLRDRLSDAFFDPIIQSKNKIAVVQSVIDRLGFSMARLGEEIDGGHCPRETSTFGNGICDRMTFLYGRMWKHDHVAALHKHWKDLVGIGPGVVQRHLYYQLLHGRVVNREGLNVYLLKDNIRHWEGIRTLFMHGDDSRVFNPNSATESAVRMRQVLDARMEEAKKHGEPLPPSTTVGLRRIPAYGHMDVILADTAPEESFQYLRAFFAGEFDSERKSQSKLTLDPIRRLEGAHTLATIRPLTGPVLRAARLDGDNLVLRLWVELPIDNTSPSVGMEFNVKTVGVEPVHEIDLGKRVGKQYRWFDVTLPVDAYKQITAQCIPGGPVAKGFLARRELHQRLLAGLLSGRDAAAVLKEAVGALHQAGATPNDPAWLRHLKSKSRDCNFIVGSCRYPGTPFDASGADQAFEGMLKLLETGVDCELVFLVGDQIYSDATGGVLDPTPWRDRYVDRYRAAFESEAFAAILNTVPCHFAIDDHEFVDNYAGYKATDNDSPPALDREAEEIALLRSSGMSRAQFLFARDVSRAYISSGRSGTAFGDSTAHRKRFWYALDDRAEITCPAFILDTRAERRRAGNGGAARLMSHMQMRAFQCWLTKHKNDDRPKFVFLGSPIVPLIRDYGRPGAWMRQDGPTGYPAELGRIVAHIAREGVERVVFVGGDAHLSCAGMMDFMALADERRSVKSLHIVSSGLYSPLTFANVSPAEFDWTDVTNRRGHISLPGAAVDYDQNLLVAGPPHFLHVSAVPNASAWTIGVTAYGRDGKQIKQLRFSF
jgi:cholesterol oxidase